MPELLTLQDLANGHLDVKALGEAANGDENTIVTTRTGNTYPSAERAINIMFKNGGLPATPFATKALMTASALANGKYAQVTDDTDNNGLYLKTAGAWVKSDYDPVTQSKAYTDAQAKGKKTIALTEGNLQPSGFGVQPVNSVATTPEYTRSYSGESLEIQYIAGYRMYVKVFQYNANKELIANPGVNATDGALATVALLDGYFKYNVTLYDLDNNVIRPVLNLLPNFKSSINHVYNRLLREYAEVGAINNLLTANMPLEVGSIETSTGGYAYRKHGFITSALLLDTSPNFLAERRTRKFLEVLSGTPVTITHSDGLARIFEYNENFETIKSYEIVSGQSYIMHSQTKYLKASFEQITAPYPTASIKIESRSNTPNWVYNVANNNRTWANINFVYEAYPSEGRQLYGDDVNNQQYSKTRYYNTGVLKLPPNYNPLGEPTRLIIFIQGSGGYLHISAGSINAGYELLDVSDEGIFNYWLNEGYAILGIYPWTSKYILDHGVNQGTPTAMAAYAQAYQWVINNYNIHKDGVFVSAKSSGGFCGALLSYNMGIPVKATALLAPVISPIREPFGAYYATRLAYTEDFGFVGDPSVVLAQQGTSPAVRWTDELRNYIRQNADKIVGYNPFWAGLIGEDLDTLVEEAVTKTETTYELNKSKQRICPVPIKIWAAVDDYVNTYEQSRVYVQSIRNTGGNAEMRTMPNDTGGHYSVDVDSNAPRLATITTNLGIVHKNIALAMVEVIQYFRRFE